MFRILFFLLFCTLFQMCDTPKKKLKEKEKSDDAKEVNVESIKSESSHTKREVPFQFERKHASFYQKNKNLLNEIAKPKSDIFIDSLLFKFNNHLSLNSKEKVALLLGGTRMDGFRDHRIPKWSNQIDSLIELEIYDEASLLADSCIAIHPLSIEGIIAKWFIYTQLEKEEIANQYFQQAKSIFIGMSHSGQGDLESPHLALSQNAIKEYTSKHAAGAGYRFISKGMDGDGNEIFLYYGLGNDYFIIPKIE